MAANYGAVWAFLATEGLTFKKSLHAAEQHRPDIAARHGRWRRHQHRIDPTRLVFVDEIWAKTNMTRTHGRAPRGQRLAARVPHWHWKTETFLAALRSDRVEAPCVAEGLINGAIFLARVQPLLVHTQKPGDAVVLDNLGSQWGIAVRRAIRSVGAHLPFLSPHSPDQNLIEMLLARLKTLLRKADKRAIADAWHRGDILLCAYFPRRVHQLLQT